MTQIFFDLDGPVLDVSEKYYCVYSDLVLQLGGQPLKKDIYWEMKRHRVPDSIILELSSLSKNLTEKYRLLRKNLIESEKYLTKDKIQTGMIEILSGLSRKHTMYIITFRNNVATLNNQLVDLGLTQYFKNIFAVQEGQIDRWKIKANMILNTIKESDPRDTLWMIGDTETDVFAGTAAGACTIAVSYGIRASNWLLLTNPTHLINKPEDLLEII